MNAESMQFAYHTLNVDEITSIGRLISFLAVTHHIIGKTETRLMNCFHTGTLTREEIKMLLKKGTTFRPYIRYNIFRTFEKGTQSV